jgi:asparagine synthase (glutamine-hydrolysing)
MAHRGPDSEGIWQDETAGLAVRRLAIIDLDERSDQPLHLGPWHLAFNGEIYNYREVRNDLRKRGHHFVTEGDGEVLLHAWAEWEDGALDRFNGMFAFAVWNDERRELVCARDPFGEKPFYWASGDGCFTFASSVHSILAVRPDLRSPRTDALGPFLGLGAMPSPDLSFFRDISVLPAAHQLRVKDDRVKVSRYWSPSPVEVPPRYEDAVDELRELLDDSVRLRLRSDVPVGSSLSGGIDSSVLVALASRNASVARRHAFTASFPGFDRDELRYAVAVAQASGLEQHHIVRPTAAEWFADAAEVVCFHEEPFGSTSVYAQWQVMRSARDSGVTVLLDGQGADELFGGYPQINAWALSAQGVSAAIKGIMRGRDRLAFLYILGSERAPAGVKRWHRGRQVPPYLSDALRQDAATASPPEINTGAFQNLLARELYRQTFYSSLPELLRYADRSSMAFSREVRLPFLDRRVAEYALSLPPEFVYRNGTKKAILRDAVRGIVPDAVLDRKDKVGFEPPQTAWLSDSHWAARIGDLMLDSEATSRGFYRTEEIRSDLRSGRWRDPRGIWRAVILEMWLRAIARTPAAV